MWGGGPGDLHPADVHGVLHGDERPGKRPRRLREVADIDHPERGHHGKRLVADDGVTARPLE
jgi:hypothetical protein